MSYPCKQNSEMLAEGELRSNLDESDRVRDLQDKVADLKAEVSYKFDLPIHQMNCAERKKKDFENT